MRHASFPAARAFAEFCLAGQTDKHGEPLTAHAERMAYSFRDHRDRHYLAVLSILHDVVEDAPVDIDFATGTLRDRQEGLSLFVGVQLCYDLRAISRCEGETYRDYIRRIRDCADADHAVTVKIADLQDHLAQDCPDSLRKRYEWALDCFDGDVE